MGTIRAWAREKAEDTQNFFNGKTELPKVSAKVDEFYRPLPTTMAAYQSRQKQLNIFDIGSRIAQIQLGTSHWMQKTQERLLKRDEHRAHLGEAQGAMTWQKNMQWLLGFAQGAVMLANLGATKFSDTVLGIGGNVPSFPIFSLFGDGNRQPLNLLSFTGLAIAQKGWSELVPADPSGKEDLRKQIVSTIGMGSQAVQGGNGYVAAAAQPTYQVHSVLGQTAGQDGEAAGHAKSEFSQQQRSDAEAAAQLVQQEGQIHSKIGEIGR